MSSVASVELKLKPSTRLLMLAAGLHALVLVLGMFSLPGGWPMATFAAAVALSWFWLRRHPALGFGAQAIQGLIAQADGSWTLRLAGGDIRAPTVAGTVWGSLLVLRFRTVQGRMLTRALAGGEATDEALRRLRVRLMTRT